MINHDVLSASTKNRVPEIPATYDVVDALECAKEIGAAILKLGVRPVDLQAQFSAMEKTIDPAQSTTVGHVVNTMTSLRDVTDSLKSMLDNPPNIVNIYEFELGSSCRPHQDYGGNLLDYSLLVPIFHGAEFAIHDSETEQSLFESYYGPGDVMFLRQNHSKLEPVVHSASVVKRSLDSASTRVLLSIDNSN